MPEDDETPSEPEPMPQRMKLPVPSVPLPLYFLFGNVMAGTEPVILCTAFNDAGSQIQGFFSPEVASKTGRDLLKAARDCENHRPKRLVVPGQTLLTPQ